jgi:hypothetical protein
VLITEAVLMAGLGMSRAEIRALTLTESEVFLDVIREMRQPS